MLETIGIVVALLIFCVLAGAVAQYYNQKLTEQAVRDVLDERIKFKAGKCRVCAFHKHMVSLGILEGPPAAHGCTDVE